MSIRFFETCAVEKYIAGILSKNKEKATPVYDSILAYLFIFGLYIICGRIETCVSILRQQI